jgi:putative lipoprotein
MFSKGLKMRLLCLAFALIATLPMIASSAGAQSETMKAEIMKVTVSYRERIALPPDAELEVQLLDVSRADALSQRIASQRFVMTAVPMTVTLKYDEQIIDPKASYSVVAAIWSGGKQMFRTTSRHDPFPAEGAAGVDIMLTMISGNEEDMTALPRRISGVQWAVTEVMGEVWGNDDPATLIIDDQMNFSIFGGCNRFSGQLTVWDGKVAFPQNFAGTLMACPDETEALERSFLDALTRVSGYVRYGGGLVMTDPLGNAVLHFEERPE